MRQLKISQSITYRDSQSIEKYLHEISRIDMIPADEEAKLARRIKNGDQQALQRLVSANLRFVVSVAKQYPNHYLSLNDLINDGNLGLIKASLRFDETSGFKFISYAVWWIRQSIIQAIQEQSRVIRLPVNRASDLNKIKKSFAHLEQKFEREPTNEELSEVMDMNIEQIEETMRSANKHQSIDAPFEEGESGSLMDVLEDTSLDVADNHMVYTDSLKTDTERILGRLNDIQRKVVKMYFGLGGYEAMRLDSIAKELGLTKERIRQIKDRALLSLRNCADSGMLKDYLCQ
jgi:RNA polymerase primary sigma factor